MFEQAFKNIDDILWKEAGCTTELDYTEQTSWLLFLKYLDGLEQDRVDEAALEGKTYAYILDKPYRWETWAAPKGNDGKLDHNKALSGDDLRDFVNQNLFPYLQGFTQKATGANTIEYKIGQIFAEIKNKIQRGYNLREIIGHIDELRFRSQNEKYELSHRYEAKIKNMGNAGRNGGEYYTARPLVRAIIQVVQRKLGESVYDGALGSAGFHCETFDGLGDRFISFEKFQTLRSVEIFPGDLLITMMGTIGKVAIVPDGIETSIMDSHLLRVRPDQKLCRTDYLAWAVYGSPAVQQSMETQAHGAIMMGINSAIVRSLPILLPPLPAQQRIVGILDEAFEGIATAKANAEKNLQNARALFESHLQSVFTQRGEGWVEKRLGDESLIEIIDGDRGVNYPKATDFYDEGHCLFLNTKNVRPDGFDFESTMFITAEKDGQLRKGKLKRDDVVMTTRGTIGNIGLYSEDVPFDNVRINSGMLIFRPNKHLLLPLFLFAMLRSEIVKEQIKKHTTGAAQPQLPIKTLVNFTIPVPDNLEDQSMLVAKLHAFEPETQRLESIYQQKLTALEALKKSLLHQAFSGQL